MDEPVMGRTVILVSARRAIAVVVALALLALAQTLTATQRDSSLHEVEAAGRHAAVARASEVASALDAETKNAAARASVAGSTDTIKRLALVWTDAATVSDFFTNEASWKPYRDEFDGSLLYRSPTERAGSGVLASAEGIEPLVSAVRAQRTLGAVRRVGDEARLVAASVVDLPPLPGQEPPVIILCKRLGTAVLAKLVPRGTLAVLLTDGQRPLESWGSAADRARLSAFAGRESQAQVGLTEGSWAVAAQTVAPGLWVWSAVDTSSDAQAAVASAASTGLPIEVGALVLALVALGFGFLSRGPVPVATSTPAPIGGLSRTVVSSPNLGADPSMGSGQTLPMGVVAPTPAHDTLVDPTANGGIAFGRYVLIDRLGQGGMGDVYLGVAHGAEGFKRNFVVKRLRPELANEPTVVAQFVEEARLGSTLVHSNIIPVFDFGKVGDEYFLTQEYILGRDLEKLTLRCLEREGHALPAAAAYYCVNQVLQALAFVHGKTDDAGVPLTLVHRDISPQNVMVSARGEVKLFDFGIVKSADRPNKTRDGVVKGNIVFMAPEQARGLEVDHRADLFSLGLVLARLLMGDVLYQGATTYDLMVRAAAGLNEEQWARVDALPAPAPTILRRALQVDPAARFQSASEFAAALPPPAASAQQELAGLVERLMGEDLRVERERIASRGPGAVSRTAGSMATA